MKRKILAVLLSATMLLTVAGCGNSNKTSNNSSNSEKLDDEQVLNTIYFEVATLDANDCTDNQSSSILAAVQEGLTRVENDGTGDKLVSLKWNVHVNPSSEVSQLSAPAGTNLSPVPSFSTLVNPS